MPSQELLLLLATPPCREKNYYYFYFAPLSREENIELLATGGILTNFCTNYFSLTDAKFIGCWDDLEWMVWSFGGDNKEGMVMVGLEI